MKLSRLLLVALLPLLAACSSGHKNGWPDRAAIQSGEEVTVKEGENVYALARSHGVSMREVIVLNELEPPYKIQPGQRLVLPMKYNADPTLPVASPRGSIESVPLSSSAVTAVPLSDPAPAPSSSSYAAPTPLERGPRYANTPSAPVETTVASNEAAGGSAAPISAASAGAASGAAKPVETSEEEASAASSSFRVSAPVQGPIIAGFGQGNDGINIGAPKGAPVVAAEGGIVVYAGNEMKGFGNLILIRHEGGWVTAYAHLDRILVSKDPILARGDQIGTVGATGGVSVPQLHFETRFNSKPMDPKKVMK